MRGVAGFGWRLVANRKILKRKGREEAAKDAKKFGHHGRQDLLLSWV